MNVNCEICHYYDLYFHTPFSFLLLPELIRWQKKLTSVKRNMFEISGETPMVQRRTAPRGSIFHDEVRKIIIIFFFKSPKCWDVIVRDSAERTGWVLPLRTTPTDWLCPHPNPLQSNSTTLFALAH